MIKYKLEKQVELGPHTTVEFYKSDYNIQPIIKVVSDKKDLIIMAGHSGGEDVGFEVLNESDFESYLLHGNPNL